MSGRHRYGAVLLLTVVTVLFTIAAPDEAWARGVAVALLGSIVLAGLRTSASRQLGAPTGSVVTVAVLVGAPLVSLDVAGRPLTFALACSLALAAIPAVGTGVVGLLRERGVTVQIVLGGVTVYLLLGLTFAFAIGLGAAVSDGPWFAAGTDGTPGERVYYSFATLTTTGYGDFTPATGGGHALAVLEMLTGQLYLVTVIGVLVSGLRRRS